ncbi:copper chaperone PCu(A)C [Nonomuraea zeae]|uniref:Copper chaperone PCu(A)C n=1 Tax=Nonomuraea zeae TaxID=1642303 RepID=A0A5S4FQ79_9ACTN|nr:copper chaperone PCu(A)C [Nonomuraea zeae]TMR22739.1 copper chaperone PCu(A)C [Nonomuraea zeae]
MFSRHALMLAAAVAAVTLTGCGGSPTTAAAPSPAAPSPAASTSPSASASPAAAPSSTGVAGLSITDPWVKTTKKGMTAAFGTLVNDGDTAVTVVSGATPLSPMVELHEVVESGGKMVMRPKEGGFVVPPHGIHQLQPGGDHIMLMGVTKAVQPGARIPFTLQVKDGEPLEFTAVGKDFAGGEEDYQPGHK